MTKTVIRIALALLFLVGATPTPVFADGGDPRPPLCFPGENCG